MHKNRFIELTQVQNILFLDDRPIRASRLTHKIASEFRILEAIVRWGGENYWQYDW